MKTSLGISSSRIFVGIALLSLTLAAQAAPDIHFSHDSWISGGSGPCTNATGSAARFDGPDGVAADTSGNLYVSDYNNHLIRKVTPTGVVTTFAGSVTPGSANGTGTAASFDFPGGLAIDTGGNLYVADSGNHTIRKITPGAVVTTLAGSAGQVGSTDNTGSLARFNNPLGVAVDGSGNILVADTANNTIRSITPGGVVSTVAGLAGSSGSANGTGTAARFTHPFGLAVDGSGNIFVADNGNHLIRKIAPGGIVTTLAGSVGSSGSNDGTGTAAKFNAPYSLAIDSSGNVFVADYNNDTIRVVTPAGVVTTLGGVPHVVGNGDGTGSGAYFNHPAAIVMDSLDNLYVGDAGNDTIRKGRPLTVGADFNWDHRSDILWKNDSTGDYGVWFMNGTGIDSGAGYTSAGWQIVGLADFNGDRKTDILWRNSNTGDVSLWEMNGATIVSDSVLLSNAGTAWAPINTADFNGDGKADILWHNATTGDYGIWLMDGTTIISSANFSVAGWELAEIGDFNGDGKADIFWLNTTTGDYGIWLMDGTTVIGGANYSAAGWEVTALGDFNGDGKSDIIWRNMTTGDYGIWLMDGTSIIGGANYSVAGWEVAKVGDFNGDGKTDILWRNTPTGNYGLWLMDGLNIITGAGYDVAGWEAVGVGDYNGDGKTDIIWLLTATGDCGLWLMDGTLIIGNAGI